MQVGTDKANEEAKEGKGTEAEVQNGTDDKEETKPEKMASDVADSDSDKVTLTPMTQT